MAVERSAEENPKGGGDGRIFLRRRGEQQEDLVPPYAVPVVQGLRDRFMRILYPIPEILPDPRARFIQIVNTCHALAEAGNSVSLLTGMKPGCTAEEIGRIYGVRPIPNLEIVGMPVVFEIHEIFHLSTVQERKREEIRRREYRVYGEADAVVTLSVKLKDHLAEMGISGSPVFVVPHGVRKEWFDVDRKAPGSYLCYVGSLYRWKGVDTLIAAMKHLPGEELVVVGGGERLAGLERMAIEEGVGARVRFTGAAPHGGIPGLL